MFGHTHPTLLRIEQVALQMRLLLRDSKEYFSIDKCEAFHRKFDVEFTENAFTSHISFYRQSHYLAIDLTIPWHPQKTAYVGVHGSTGELVVFLSCRNPYPEYLPDHAQDIMTMYAPNPLQPCDYKWAAKEALDFFLWEE